PAGGTTPAAGGAFRQAVAFLTPVGGAAAPGPAALAWFPVVGALIGLASGGVWWAVDDRLGPLAAAALVVAADLGLTRALHFDGRRSVVAVAAAVLATAGVAALARRRIGGFTGDTLGAGGVVAETVGLLVALALVRP